MTYELRVERLDEALASLVNEALLEPRWPDGYHPRFVHKHDVTIYVQDARPEIDLVTAGMKGPTRWAKFVREYTDPSFPSFLHSLGSLRRPAQEARYTCPVKAGHGLGNCLLGVSVRGLPRPQVTLFSGTTTWLPTGGLDLSFGALIAIRMSQLLEQPIPLRWHIATLQLYAMEALPYLLTMGFALPVAETTHWAGRLNHDYHRAVQGGTSKRAPINRLLTRIRERAAGLRPEPYYPRLPEAGTLDLGLVLAPVDDGDDDPDGRDPSAEER